MKTPPAEGELDAKKQREQRIVTRFIEVFCRENHHPPEGDLCEDCADLLAYARRKLAQCPFDPKPKFKHCTVHCYQAEYRKKIQEVMKFSGIYFVKRGRLDWLVKYFMT